MNEHMVYLDALIKHVDTWVSCDPPTIAKLLEGATTEQARLEVVLGAHLRPLFESAQGSPLEPEQVGLY